MYLSEFIAQLQIIRAPHGDIQVWVKDGVPPSPQASVQDMLPIRPSDPAEKIVWIEYMKYIARPRSGFRRCTVHL